MEKKLRSHGIRRIFYDILRDTNNAKYSMTKFAALAGLIALFATVTMSLIVMWQKKEIDHVLIVELIGFILTLLGFKNSFGYKGKDSNNSDNVGTGNNNETNLDAENQLLNPQKPDVVDDRFKG